MLNRNFSNWRSGILYHLSLHGTQMTLLIPLTGFTSVEPGRLLNGEQTLQFSYQIITSPSEPVFLLLKLDITPKTTLETPKSSKWTSTKRSWTRALSGILSR